MTKYSDGGYGAMPVGFGARPAILVVDFQLGFTDPRYPMGGAPMVTRAVENTARVLEVARSRGVPVVSCAMAYARDRDKPYWKVRAVRDGLLLGDESVALDPRIHDARYDYAVIKGAPSIFFETPVASFLLKQRVDTTVVTGCITSGCVRASVVDSFSYKFRTIVPEDCVGDHDEEPHRANLRDMERRYCDVSNADVVIAWLRSDAVQAAAE